MLGFLDANGGQLTHQELAAALETTQSRLRGLVATIARAVNLDGYPIVQDQGDRITFDSKMAARQFGIF